MGWCTNLRCGGVCGSTTGPPSPEDALAPPLQGDVGQALHDKVKAVEVLDAHRLRFVCMHLARLPTFYATPRPALPGLSPKVSRTGR